MVYPAACWKKTLTYFLALLNNIEPFLQRPSSAVLEVCRYRSYTKTETCVKKRFCRRKHCKTSSSENELKATGLERFRNPQQLALMVALWGKWLHEENTKEKLIFYIKEVNAMLFWIRIILNPRSLMGSSVSWRLGSTSIPRTHSDSTVKSKHTDSHNRIILRPLFLIVQMLF